MDNTAQEYINKMREAGKSDSEIKQEMVGAGWDEKDIILQKNQRQTLHSEKSTRWLKIAIITVIIIALEIAAYYFLSYIPKKKIVQDANLTECIREAGYQKTNEADCYRQYPSTQRSKEAICLADAEVLPTESLDDNCKIFSQCLADAKALKSESNQIVCLQEGRGEGCLNPLKTENISLILKRYYSDVDNCKNDFLQTNN
ncbi:hypothetical protein IID19_04120 [Patescibacteria group bacterium]|nr:hypothetical protein [Patescibacteria group bacterium]